MPTLTITFTNDQADRIQAAFVERLNDAPFDPS